MKADRSKVSSRRADLSNTGICGSIPRSSTSQARFGAEPYAVSATNGPQAEAVLRALDHSALGGDLGLADRGGRLDIDDDSMVEIDQVFVL